MDQSNSRQPWILIFRYDESLFHMLTEVLTLEGYPIEGVRTSAEALAFCEHPGGRCVVLMDNYHLNQQAIIFAKTVFARPDLHARVRIVGLNNSNMRGRALQEIDEFLRMPFSLDEFLEPIVRLCADLQRKTDVTRTGKDSSKANQARIFISHHHSESEDLFTARLVADLEAAGADVWVDTSGITSDDFVQKISEGLDGRQWLVLVMTPDAVASPWVRREVNAALNELTYGRMLGVLPVVMKPCRDQDIPVLWRPLHRYDATAAYEPARDGLLRALKLSQPVRRSATN